MTDQKIDVASGLKTAFEHASPETRQLVGRVLEIERANQHLSVPRVGEDIKRAIAEAAKSASAS